MNRGPAEFPEDLGRFIRRSLPSYRAAEVLVHVARDEARSWTAEEIAEAIPALAADAVRKDLDHLAREELLAAEPDGRYRFAPRTEESRAGVALLVEAYDRRPVTLVRIMDSLATERIRSFADSFRLKKRD